MTIAVATALFPTYCKFYSVILTDCCTVDIFTACVVASFDFRLLLFLMVYVSLFVILWKNSHGCHHKTFNIDGQWFWGFAVTFWAKLGHKLQITEPEIFFFKLYVGYNCLIWWGWGLLWLGPIVEVLLLMMLNRQCADDEWSASDCYQLWTHAQMSIRFTFSFLGDCHQWICWVDNSW